MKKFKKIMAVLVAAMIVMSSMTITAFAVDPEQGRLATAEGKIIISNPHSDSLYKIYRMFELASFIDPAEGTGAHDAATEHYSYVIDFMPNTTNPAVSDNPWWTFLTTYGPKGTPISPTNYAYAVVDDGNLTTAQKENAYFIIQAAPITVTNKSGVDVSTYHVIKAGSKLLHSTGDASTGLDDMASATDRANDPGNDADYVISSATNYNKIVQDFAQEALKYVETATIDTTFSARAKSVDVPPAIQIGNGVVTTSLENGENYLQNTSVPLGYYLISSSMGTLASLDTTNKTVTVYEKNDEPTIEKKVRLKGDVNKLKARTGYETGTSDDEKAAALAAYRAAYFGDEGWVANTDANVGDFVQFRIKIRAQQGVKDYKIHDVMEQGLTFIDSSNANYNTYPVEVKLVRYNPTETSITNVYSVEASETVSGGTKNNWVVDVPDSGAGDNTMAKRAATENADFILSFLDADLADYGNDQVVLAVTEEDKAAATPTLVDIKDDDFIYVYYWAQVNVSAAIYDNEADDGSVTGIIGNNGTALPSTIGNKKYVKNANGRNDNHAILTYGNKNTEVTTWTTAYVTTYGFDLVKTEDSNGDTVYNLLEKAKFNLFKAEEIPVLTTGEPEAIAASIADAEAAADYTYTTAGSTPSTTYYKKSLNAALKFKADSATTTLGYLYRGNLDDGTDDALIESANKKEKWIRGLEAGTYLLYETEAPIGYDILPYPIVIKINGDIGNDAAGTDTPAEGTINYFTTNYKNQPSTGNKGWNAGVTVNGTTYIYEDEYDFDSDANTPKDTNGGLVIENTTSQELPSTGGMGTTVLYIVGGMMVILAGAYLFFNKKRNAA